MKLNISNILNGVAGAAAVLSLWSCSAENPFDTDGEGIVQLRTVVNSITTRADNYSQEELEKKCVIYISDKSKTENALVYKKVGLENIDSQIVLKAGSYVAEAWTGDSVTASFDKKFYRGYQPFDVTKGSTSNVVVNCRIANVVASINTQTIDPNLMKDDYKITIENSRDGLTFTKDNAVEAKAYFMMPDNDTSLKYTIEGSRKDGKPFKKDGTIENVERAHHYILNFDYNPEETSDPTTTGAAFLTINIKEEIIDNSSVNVFTRPTVTGVDFDIAKQLVFVNDDDIPEKVSVQICGFGGLDEIVMKLGCCTWKVLLALNTENDKIKGDKIDFNNADNNIIEFLKAHGVEYIAPEMNNETNETKVETAFINFSKDIFTRLIRKPEEHVFTFTVKDKNGLDQEATLRIARTEEAIVYEDPITIDKVDQNDWKSISSNSVNLSFTLAHKYEGVPGVEYSKADEDNWTFVAANVSANAPRNSITRDVKKYSVTISGLDAGTSYKYRACCGDFHSEDVMTFETYSKFVIPNWNMEQWAEVSAGGQKGVKVPSRTGSLDFWGNGNPGAKTAKTILTDESTDMFQSPSKSARLESKFASVMGIGKFAAGNLFAGEYVKTDVTDGVLKFGQPFSDFSDGKKVDVRPSALKVYVNYRPKPGVNKRGADSSYIGEGQMDQAQIYVALTTAPIDIMTKNTNRKLFNPDDTEVLAYGQYTFESDFGPDGKLQELIIPIEYFERSDGVLPTHLVIVCSASKYGDFFSGGEGSTMYVDDFELIYE